MKNKILGRSCNFDLIPNPFCSCRNFTNDEIEKIWKSQYSNENEKEEIKEIKVTKVLEKKEEGMYILAQKCNISDEFFILKYPVTITVEDKIKDLKIFTLNQMETILKILTERNYKIYLNGEEFDYQKLSYKQNNIIEAKYKEKEYSEFKKYILGNNGILIKEKKILVVQKSSLSLYFEQISKSNNDENEKEFKLIINENRLNLFEKINKFYKSDFSFYLLMGAYGIGKTISFIYYSSCVYLEYRVFYLNLKLFKKKSLEQCEEIFFNELKRIFLCNYKYPNIAYEKYEILKKEILDYLHKNYSNIYHLTGMNYTWTLLISFLKVYAHFEIFPSDMIMILDQYKLQGVDEDFIYLNNVLEIVDDMLNIPYNRIKLIIIISINNNDTKDIFTDNFINISIYNLLNINNKEEKQETKDNKCI